MATFDQFINSIIADGNDGKAFEKFCKHFLETSPEYSHQFEKVWLWDDWPSKWSHDKGIDLVAKYKGRDRYCAIQAKCYAAHNTVPYNEVTNFLADSSRAEIEDRILMMSTNKLNEKTSKEVISGQEKQVTILDRDYFENKAKFDYPAHISELGKAKAKPPATPRKHQITAINDVEKGLQENDRGQLIMACGTGKTFTTLWIKERLGANAVLVLLPSLSLLSQTMREWVWGANERFEALAVCSDPTVGKSKNSDEDISTAEVGKVTWHVDEIQAFLRSPNPKVIFCTYQSSELIQLAQEDETIPQFDLVVCDEAHRCAGKANAGFATVLHEEKIRAKKRLFTTATPRYYGKSVQSAAEGRGVEVIGMDDEAKFGPVVHKLTFGQAIAMNKLTDYQVVVVGVDEPMVREWITEGEIVSYGDENHTDARTLAAKIAVLKAIKDYDLKRVISFHTNIKRAKEFASDVFDVAALIDVKQRPSGKIWSQHVDGTMSAGKRRDLINGLKELDGHEIGLLTNARCLSEGVDVPTLDGVAFVDPRGSQVDIIQAVGRAIRKSDNKNTGTIVLPVFLEVGDDPDTVIDASNFKPVWDVLKALRAHDEVLADELDQYRTDMGLGVKRNSDRIEKIVFDLPLSITSTFSAALSVRAVEAGTDNWFFWFGLLMKYREQNGHSAVPSQYIDRNGNKLGTWCSVQRQKYIKNLLTKEKVKQLNNLNFIWDLLDYQWELGFSELQSFYFSHGNCSVPKRHVCKSGFNLGLWVLSQRQAFKKDSITAERISKLDELDFVWDPKEDQWRVGVRHLRDYYAQNGHCNPPNTFKTQDGFSLGFWVTHTRKLIKEGKLSNNRKTLIDDLPIALDVKKFHWDRGFNELKNYVNEFGDANVPYGFEAQSGFKLGSWVGYQRAAIKNKKGDGLTKLQLKKLKELNFKLDPKKNSWDHNLRALKQYIAIHGHADVPGNFITKNGVNLGIWINNLRKAHRNSTLPSEKYDELVELGISWSITDDAFKKWLSLLEAEIDKFKSPRISQNYVATNGEKLGQWLSNQRRKFKAGKLSKDQLKQLLATGVTLETEDTFSKNLNLLEVYKSQFGNCNVPQNYKTADGFSLGSWVQKIRSRNNKNGLLANEKNELDKIGFIWDVNEFQWNLAITELRKYIKMYGDTLVPAKHVSDTGFRLGKWVNHRRNFYTSGKLSQEKIEELEKLGFVWVAK